MDDYTKLGKVTFTVRIHTEDNIEEGTIGFTGNKLGGFDRLPRYSAPIIFVKSTGAYYLASAIVTAITCDNSHPGITLKYGRRQYHRINENLLDALLGSSAAWRVNTREERIAYERGQFVEALIDFS